jgi:hypothetical protein
MSPMVSLSLETKPSMDPEPYWMENSVPLALYVEEALESYLVWRKQAMEVHLVLGTQRLLDLQGTWLGGEHIELNSLAYPVSRITLNCKVGSGPVNKSSKGARTV